MSSTMTSATMHSVRQTSPIITRAGQCRSTAQHGSNRIDLDSPPDEQAVGDKAQGRGVDQAAALIDQIQKGAIDVGIFARAVVIAPLAVEDQSRSAILQAKPESVGRLDGNRPLFILA